MRLSRPLWALIAAEVVSSLGSLMSAVALPWFVLEATGSPTRMSIVLAAESAPLLLVGIPSSRLVARIGSRRSLLLCDLAWALVIALIPCLHFAGALSFWLLVVLAFLAGVPWAAHAGSQSAIVPELLGEDAGSVAEANALLQTLSRLAYFVGPALGGVLLAALGAPTVLLIDAGTFLVSFLLVAALIPDTTSATDAEPSAGVAGGWALIRRDAWLRPVTAAQGLSQGAFMAMTAAIPVLAFSTYERDAALAGLLLGIWGAGAMIGSAAAVRLVRSTDPYRLGAAAWATQALPLWAVAASRAPAVAAVALGLSGIANGIRVPPITGLTMQRIPKRIRAETMTVASSLVLGAGFLALLGSGPALDHLGIGPVWAAVAAIQTAAAAIFARAALLRAPRATAQEEPSATVPLPE